MICSIGTGLTAASRVFVRKSQKILGQKKPSSAAATWSVRCVSQMFVKHVMERCKLPHTSSSSQYNEPRPVVLNEFSHVDD